MNAKIEMRIDAGVYGLAIEAVKRYMRNTHVDECETDVDFKNCIAKQVAFDKYIFIFCDFFNEEVYMCSLERDSSREYETLVECKE